MPGSFARTVAISLLTHAPSTWACTRHCSTSLSPMFTVTTTTLLRCERRNASASGSCQIPVGGPAAVMPMSCRLSTTPTAFAPVVTRLSACSRLRLPNVIRDPLSDRCAVSRRPPRSRHPRPRLERVLDLTEGSPELREVAQQHALHRVLLDPVEPGLRVHLRRVVGGEEAVALQAP